MSETEESEYIPRNFSVCPGCDKRATSVDAELVRVNNSEIDVILFRCSDPSCSTVLGAQWNTGDPKYWNQIAEDLRKVR
jgi:hypothetical protein